MEPIQTSLLLAERFVISLGGLLYDSVPVENILYAASGDFLYDNAPIDCICAQIRLGQRLG